MRVIGGELGGRRLGAPRGMATRPSADRLREALFNILGTEVEGRSFVDAFAGTGAVGIEALSRGAREAVFIESAGGAAAAVRENLRRLGIGREAALVWERPVLPALSALERRGGCDLFFLDPPYDDHRARTEVLRALAARPGLVRAGGRVVAEARRRDGRAEEPGGRLRLEREHAVGDSALWFYRAE